MQNIISAVLGDMAQHGVVPKDKLILDGTLHRAYAEGDKPGTRNISYIIHVDENPSFYYEYFPKSLKVTGTLTGTKRRLTVSELRQIEAERKKRQSERKNRQMETARKAQRIWFLAKCISDTSEHLYLVKKDIKPYVSRVYNGALVVPLFDEAGKLVNLQFINAEGDKRFMTGGKKRECFSVIGDSKKCEKLLICEGFATGASLHEDTGLLVLVAMDAGNLGLVAQAARRLFPASEIVIAGDNDLSGVGQDAARKAALACGGKFIIPPEPGTDWNDIISHKTRTNHAD